MEELIKSSTANRLGIDNTPSKEIISNLTELSILLQKIRDIYNKPIIITSGYRSTKLNKAVGGSKTSQHRLGQAADIRSVSDTKRQSRAI